MPRHPFPCLPLRFCVSDLSLATACSKLSFSEKLFDQLIVQWNATQTLFKPARLDLNDVELCEVLLFVRSRL